LISDAAIRMEPATGLHDRIVGPSATTNSAPGCTTRCEWVMPEALERRVNVPGTGMVRPWARLWHWRIRKLDCTTALRPGLTVTGCPGDELQWRSTITSRSPFDGGGARRSWVATG